MAHTKDSAPKTRSRRMRGFEQASTLLSGQLSRAAERRGFAISRLLTQWAEIVGPEIAAMARPLRISHGRGNGRGDAGAGFGATLTLLTAGPVAPLVEMQLPRLRERVNACYGYNAIQRITLTQTAPEGFAEAQAVFTGAPKDAPARPDPAAEASAQAVAARFSDPGLAAAMARLTLNHAARQTRRP